MLLSLICIAIGIYGVISLFNIIKGGKDRK